MIVSDGNMVFNQLCVLHNFCPCHDVFGLWVRLICEYLKTHTNTNTFIYIHTKK